MCPRSCNTAPTPGRLPKSSAEGRVYLAAHTAPQDRAATQFGGATLRLLSSDTRLVLRFPLSRPLTSLSRGPEARGRSDPPVPDPPAPERGRATAPRGSRKGQAFVSREDPVRASGCLLFVPCWWKTTHTSPTSVWRARSSSRFLSHSLPLLLRTSPLDSLINSRHNSPSPPVRGHRESALEKGGLSYPTTPFWKVTWLGILSTGLR